MEGKLTQTPYDSEGLIKYNYLNHSTDKPIPFDRAFTLAIENLPVKDVIAVHAYEARYINGTRYLVPVALDPAGSIVTRNRNEVAAIQELVGSEAQGVNAGLNKNIAGSSLTAGEQATVKQARDAANDRAINLTAAILKVSAGNPLTKEEAKKAGMVTSSADKGFTEAEVKAMKLARNLAKDKTNALNKVLAGTRLTDTEMEAATRSLQDVRPVKDLSLIYSSANDGLRVYFPPLKPNKLFDLLIIRKLSQVDQEALLDVNALLYQGKNQEVEKIFNQVVNRGLDPFLQRTAIDINFEQYQAFFTGTLRSVYASSASPGTFTTADALSEIQLRAIARAAKSAGLSFPRLGIGVETLTPSLSLSNDIQLGLIPVSGIYQRKSVSMAELHTRLLNLEANLRYVDSLQQVVDAVLISQPVNPVLANARKDVNRIRDEMRKNRELLLGDVKKISSALSANEQLRQVITLAGGTLASDLKTSGGNVLFIDAGLGNLGVPNVQDKLVYIPRLYWGVSIYFRPIDKNTRRNRFPRKFTPPRNFGLDPETGTFGPDYKIATRATAWQHLSLNLGFTIGSLPNNEFDNLYNSMSLLVGPAYRFRRAFKASAGLALVKRTSKDPVSADKVVIPGVYASLSTDLDFIQGLKDVTNLLFK